MRSLETEIFMLKEFKNLKLDKILFEAKSPVLFTAVAENNDPYLFLRLHEDGDKVIWSATKTTYNLLILLLENKLTIADTFMLGDVLKYAAILTKNELEFKTFSRHKCPYEFLPRSDEYLGAENGEYGEEISEFKKRMAEERFYD